MSSSPTATAVSAPKPQPPKVRLVRELCHRNFLISFC
jgi:hypothetical protein